MTQAAVAENALSTEAATPIVHWPVAVDAAAAASMFDISERQWWSLHSSGRCPLPIRCGRSVRWSVDELRRWCDAGCPPRHRWQEQRNQTD